MSDDLTERIARALTEHWKRKHSTLLTSRPCSGCSHVAADAVAAEVRKAQADAFDAGWIERAAEFAAIYRDNHYPETEDQT